MPKPNLLVFSGLAGHSGRMQRVTFSLCHAEWLDPEEIHDAED
jgi:hypothetical protein